MLTKDDNFKGAIDGMFIKKHSVIMRMRLGRSEKCLSRRTGSELPWKYCGASVFREVSECLSPSVLLNPLSSILLQCQVH